MIDIDWNALGGAGEFLGAIGVIISLLYLAVQVQQNTKSVRSSTYQALVDSAQDFALLLGSDPEIASTFTRGLADEDLSRQEQAQFTWLFHVIIRQVENGHFQAMSGAMDPELWEGWTGTLRGIVGSPGGRRMWSSVRPRLRASFVQFVEREILPTDTSASTANFVRFLATDIPERGEEA